MLDDIPSCVEKRLCMKKPDWENAVNAQFGVYREHSNAKMPEVAYSGSSACFDLFAVEDTVIPARGSSLVPVGVRLTVPNGWYVEFATRSGHGIKHNLRVHPGIIDPGYAGPWTVKMFNLGDEDVTIEKGKGAVQCKVHRIPSIYLGEISKDIFDEYRDNAERGEKGFGSSDKK